MTKRLYLISRILVIISLVAGTCGLLGHIQRIEAANLKVGVLDISYDGAPAPLFSVANLAPGYSETKIISVTNMGKIPHSFAIAVDGQLDSLAEAIIIEPSISGQIIWSKTISQIAKNPQSNIIVNSIAPSSQVEVNIRAYLPSETGNEYQGKSTLSFSFVMGNESTDEAEPQDISYTRGNNSPNLNTLPSSQTGAAGSVFNQSEPEDQSSQGQIQGVNTDGEAKGEETTAKPICFWWWVLLIFLAVVCIIYGYFKKNRQWLFDWIWPIFIAAILYAVHWILHSYYIPSVWCPYFVWLEIAILVLYYVFVSLVPEKQDGGESSSN